MPGRGHRHQEDRESLLLSLPLRCPGQEKTPLRHGGVRGPDLLAGDEPSVTIAPGRGLQRRQIRPRIRLAEALAPDGLAAGDGRQMLLLLRRRAMAHDGRADPVDTHVLRALGARGGPTSPPGRPFAPRRKHPAHPTRGATPCTAGLARRGARQNRCATSRSAGSFVKAPRKSGGTCSWISAAQLAPEGRHPFAHVEVHVYLRRPAAVDDDRLAGDVAAGVADQPQHRAHEVVHASLVRAAACCAATRHCRARRRRAPR